MTVERRVLKNGVEKWFSNGKLISKVCKDGTGKWYHNNKLHNPVGPAVIESREFDSWAKKWYCHGRLHHLEKAAVQTCYQNMAFYVHEYYVMGIRHRPYGPAIEIELNPDYPYQIDTDIENTWYLYGIKVLEETKIDEVNEWLKSHNIKPTRVARLTKKERVLFFLRFGHR